MRDFEASAYIEGTAARKLDAPRRHEARIITFPGSQVSREVSAPDKCSSRDAEAQRSSVIVSSDVLYALLHGSAAGQVSGRMTAAQTAGVVCLFAAIAFGSLFLGL